MRLRQRIIQSSLAAMLLWLSFPAEAQQPARIPRLGYVSGTGDAFNQGPYVEALRQGLRDLGYVEGRNIIIEYRGAEGKTDRYPTLVNELVQTQVDVLIVPLAIVRAQVYRLPSSGEIKASYVEVGRAVIWTRLAHAGARLAWLLNQTLR